LEIFRTGDPEDEYVPAATLTDTVYPAVSMFETIVSYAFWIVAKALEDVSPSLVSEPLDTST
jgi:hypothetical protein